MGPVASAVCCYDTCCDTGRDNLLGHVVKNAMLSFDRGLLGVDVRVGGVRAMPERWRLEIEDIFVDNPEGYKSDYLLKASSIVFDLDATALLTSFGTKAVVQELNCAGVELYYEPRIGTSNLTEVKSHLKRIRQQEESNGELQAQTRRRNRIEVTLHRVALQGVRAKVCVGRSSYGPTLKASDVVYEDFSERFRGRTAVMDIFRILLSSVLKSALGSGAAGVAGAGTAAFEGAKSSVNFAAYGAKALVGGVAGLVGSSGAMAMQCVRPEGDDRTFADRERGGPAQRSAARY